MLCCCLQKYMDNSIVDVHTKIIARTNILQKRRIHGYARIHTLSRRQQSDCENSYDWKCHE